MGQLISKRALVTGGGQGIGRASMGSGFWGMLFMGLSGWLIGSYGYTPVFIGYGIMPLIALAIVLFLIGPLQPHPKFRRLTEPQPSLG